MKSPATVVFAHGWGFDQRLWDGVIARLGVSHRVETVDFGFLGAPRMPEVGAGETVVAVGHSLGALWWLTQATMPWRRLLIINGFPRFTEGEGYAPAVAPRILARMQARFKLEPSQVLAEFRARCGVDGAADRADFDRLAQGLHWLAAWDGRATLARRAADIFVLAGADDPIVPRAMTQMAFAELPAARLDWHAGPGHVLPLEAPEACARWLAERLD